MTTFFVAIKDPDAQLDYTLDWSIWLPVGDTIAASQWVLPPDLSQVSSTNTTTTATVWLKGGVLGATYLIVNRVTTASTPARIEDRTIQIRMQAR